MFLMFLFVHNCIFFNIFLYRQIHWEGVSIDRSLFYSRFFDGTRYHKNIIHPIIATNLAPPTMSWKNHPNENRKTHNGWRLLIPCFEEIAPVRKGSAALPAWPNPAIQPMEPVRSHLGRTRPAWFIAMGYIGPKRSPTMETATAPPIREGTSQITSSSLLKIFQD